MAKGTILVVDDDPFIVELVETALQEVGYEVCSAVNEAAVQLARDVHPNAILLDIMMPGLDGVEISRRLRADETTADIPIIAMSAHSRLQTAASAMQADDQLEKPFALEHLYTTVDQWAANT